MLIGSSADCCRGRKNAYGAYVLIFIVKNHLDKICSMSNENSLFDKLLVSAAAVSLGESDWQMLNGVVTDPL